MPRTTKRWTRVYIDSTDYSSYVTSCGPIVWAYDFPTSSALSDTALSGMPNQANISAGTVNMFMHSLASAFVMPAISGTGLASRVLTIAIGSNAEPVAGDPAFCGMFPQLSYKTANVDDFVYVSADFPAMSELAPTMAFSKPWGTLLNPRTTARTAVNTAVGLDDSATSAATTFGGVMVYHALAVAGTGTAVIKVQDAATNLDANFADVTGLAATVTGNAGVITGGSTGLVATATTATIRRYVRWQIALSGLTSVTFVLSLIRSYGPGN